MEDDATQNADGLIGQLWTTFIENYGAAAPFYVLAGIGLIMMVIALPIVLRKHKDPLDRFSFSDEKLRSELVRLRDDFREYEVGLREREVDSNFVNLCYHTKFCTYFKPQRLNSGNLVVEDSFVLENKVVGGEGRAV